MLDSTSISLLWSVCSLLIMKNLSIPRLKLVWDYLIRVPLIWHIMLQKPNSGSMGEQLLTIEPFLQSPPHLFFSARYELITQSIAQVVLKLTVILLCDLPSVMITCMNHHSLLPKTNIWQRKVSHFPWVWSWISWIFSTNFCFLIFLSLSVELWAELT